MPESIESLVKKLQTEGVDAGKKAIEKTRKNATQETKKILIMAKSDADKRFYRGL
jgi:hypothetical protein